MAPPPDLTPAQRAALAIIAGMNMGRVHGRKLRHLLYLQGYDMSMAAFNAMMMDLEAAGLARGDWEDFTEDGEPLRRRVYLRRAGP